MATNPSTMCMAVLLLCCLCGALGQDTAEGTDNLKVLQDAWQATMGASTVKITKEQTRNAAEVGKEDEGDVDQKTTTTLYLRKSEDSDSTDKYAIVKMEGEKNLEAEVVVLGKDVYTMFNSGVAEDAIGEWFDGDDIAELNFGKDADRFAEATTLTGIANLLNEENIESISPADGDCYDVVPTEAYISSLAEPDTTVVLTHQVCVDTENGYLIRSTVVESHEREFESLEGDGVDRIAVTEEDETSFSEFGEDVEFPDVVGLSKEDEDSGVVETVSETVKKGSEKAVDAASEAFKASADALKSSKDALKISISAVLAAALLTLLH